MMNKEEILELSRNENESGDERDKIINLKKEYFSSAGAFIMLFVFLIIRICKGENPYDLVCIACAACVAGNIAQLLNDKNKKKGAITGLILSVLFLVLFFVKYLKFM